MSDQATIRAALEGAAAYLREHRDEARYTDSEATATLQDGLRVVARAPDGRSIETDMPKSVGGEDTAPSPGWLFRAALASCDTTLIAMNAALQGIALTSLEVTIDSASDDYGILGLDAQVPAGPLSVRARIRIASPDADAQQLKSLVEQAIARCPVCDGVKRAVPMTTEVEVL